MKSSNSFWETDNADKIYDRAQHENQLLDAYLLLYPGKYDFEIGNLVQQIGNLSEKALGLELFIKEIEILKGDLSIPLDITVDTLIIMLGEDKSILTKYKRLSQEEQKVAGEYLKIEMDGSISIKVSSFDHNKGEIGEVFSQRNLDNAKILIKLGFIDGLRFGKLFGEELARRKGRAEREKIRQEKRRAKLN